MNRVKQYQNGEERSTDALENDIQSTKQRMDDTIDALSHKLNPERYIHDAGDWVKGKIDAVDTESIKNSAVRVGRKTGDIVADHPIPIALGVLALTTWFVRKPTGYDRKIDHPYIPGHPEAEGATGFINPTLNPEVKQLPEHSENSRDNGSDSSGGRLHAVGSAVSSAAHHSSERFARGKDEYPASMALGAMALGFLAAFALPRTRTENDMYGESADELKHSLADRGREIVEETKSNIREKSGEFVKEARHLAEQKIDETQEAIDGKIEETKVAIEDQIDEKVEPS